MLKKGAGKNIHGEVFIVCESQGIGHGPGIGLFPMQNYSLQHSLGDLVESQKFETEEISAGGSK